MTDPTAPEPTMEEILASIRRIISEDDAPAGAAEPEAAAAEAPAAAPEPAPAPEPTPQPVAEAPAAFMEPAPSVAEPEAADDDVLELTDRYEAAPAESIGDLDVAEAEPAPSSYDSLVGDSAAASAASAFAGLAASFKSAEPAPTPRGADLNFASGTTVEGMVAEMLRPMLKDWLDANLPGIVQTAVQKEVERIARNAG